MARTPFEGIQRKLVIPLIVLSAIGVLLVVVGFGIGSNDDNPQPNDDPSSYLYWVVCTAGPVTLVAALVHAALWKPLSTYIGVVVMFLSLFYVTGLGMILYVNGQDIRTIIDFNKDVPDQLQQDIPNYISLEFSGALIALLFWAPVTILWSFYK